MPHPLPKGLPGHWANRQAIGTAVPNPTLPSVCMPCIPGCAVTMDTGVSNRDACGFEGIGLAPILCPGASLATGQSNKPSEQLYRTELTTPYACHASAAVLSRWTQGSQTGTLVGSRGLPHPPVQWHPWPSGNQTCRLGSCTQPSSPLRMHAMRPWLMNARRPHRHPWKSPHHECSDRACQICY